ncbi:MAG: HlyC/CorC family transporter [Gemmatimonadetes bacterium]|nr:HlyC/CorC family transporter [Gemmatimonadota bacterium]
MSPAWMPMLGAALAAAWAALLALAEGALAAEPKLAEAALPRAYAEKPERLRRALTLGRITLLALAAVAISGALRWWAAGLPGAALWPLLLAGGLALGGDLAPRAIGLWRAAWLGAWAVRVTTASLGLLVPLFVAAGVLDRAFARLFGVPTRAPGPNPAQRDMLLGVFSLADTMVSEVMTPRVDVVGLEVQESFDEAVRQVGAAEHARLPVVDGDLDHIVGVLYAKDLLPARFGRPAADTDWRKMVRPVEIVPEVKTLDAQLRDFQRGPSHMAIVVDEFGGTAGIVTLEDVLEEIVGEIRDEYDAAERQAIVETAPGCFLVQGRAPLGELAAALDVPLAHTEVTTAGGFVYATLGHVPVNGETTAIAGYRVTVERVEKRSIVRLRFERTEPEPDGRRA